MIHFKDVSFAYKEGKWAVRHINFTVNKGEFVSIIGGNGSGKSTIARLSDGLLLPQEGSVFVDEMNSHAKKDEFLIKEKVGVVFQNPDNQFVGTTVEEDIAFGLENIGIERVEAKARIKQISSLLGIDKYLHGSPSYLSGGEKQKVAIASVLVMQPDYLVMDEITALLDPVKISSDIFHSQNIVFHILFTIIEAAIINMKRKIKNKSIFLIRISRYLVRAFPTTKPLASIAIANWSALLNALSNKGSSNGKKLLARCIKLPLLNNTPRDVCAFIILVASSKSTGTKRIAIEIIKATSSVGNRTILSGEITDSKPSVSSILDVVAVSTKVKNESNISRIAI